MRRGVARRALLALAMLALAPLGACGEVDSTAAPPELLGVTCVVCHAVPLS
jgi:hypothetical protein